MRVVLQRVQEAAVRVDGEVVGAIGPGLLLLVGVAPADGPDQVAWMADRVLGLRIFADEQGRMNRSVREVGGAVLCVSQFTLYADTSRGRRPSFVGAARPEQALPLYEALCDALDARRGVFGAHMEVSLVNDGPVTLVLESP